MSWDILIALVLATTPTPGATAAPDPAAAEVVAGPNGYVRVTEIGHPPLGMAGARAKAIARENARTRARERVLKAILALQLKSGKKLEQALRERPDHRAGLRAVLNRATLSGAELTGDAVELTLTVRMDGEGGLGRYLEAVQAAESRDQ
ncbi:MAG: hypothetical protein FJZ01_14205 [Candidatus Sericytochromatia bacterium]|nr:hypothetical protein [Candidatus Tanganyikabacteria bacterium]